MIGERIGDPGGPNLNKIYEGGTIEEVVITRKRSRPGNSHAVQVYQYNAVRGANGWNVYRNSQLDRQITRYDRSNWKGAEEQHFSVFQNGHWKNYESYAEFSKAYPKHHLQGMPAKELAKLSWSATKEVAKRTWESPETQPILLAPVFALSEIFVAGEIASSSNAGRSIILSRSSGSARELTKSEPHSIYTYLSGDGKTAVSNFVYDAEGKAVLEVNFKKHTQTMLSGHGHTLEGGSKHIDHIHHTSIPNPYKAIPKKINYSQPLAK